MEASLFEKNSEGIESREQRINLYINDYKNNFNTLQNYLQEYGVDGFRIFFVDKNLKIPTVEEYTAINLRKGLKFLEENDLKDPSLIEKVEYLNLLARTINNLGEDLDEETFRFTMNEVANV